MPANPSARCPNGGHGAGRAFSGGYCVLIFTDWGLPGSEPEIHLSSLIPALVSRPFSREVRFIRFSTWMIF